MEGKILDGWGQIAARLQVSEKTAQVWEKERGLPVERRTGVRGRVWADPARIDSWRQSDRRIAPWHENVDFLRLYALALTCLVSVGVGVLIGWLLIREGTGPPADFLVEGRSIQVFDRQRRVKWTHVFDSTLFAPAYKREFMESSLIWFGDLDADGGMETLFVYLPTTVETEGTRLFCFSESGAVKWIFNPAAPAANKEQPFSEIYRIERFLVQDIDGNDELEVLLTSHHLDRYPNRFVALSSRGEVQGEYWHPGQLPCLAAADLDGDDIPEILLGGVNNARRAAVVAVLDGRRIYGAHRLESDSPLQLVSARQAAEKAYLVFPRTDANRVAHEYNVVNTVVVQPEELVVKVSESSPQERGFVIYELDPRSLGVIRLKVSDTLGEWHRQLRDDGLLDHSWSSDEHSALREVVDLSASSRSLVHR